jgi:hypothetical protein
VTLAGKELIGTFPSLFSKKQCSARMLLPLRRIAAGLSVSIRATWTNNILKYVSINPKGYEPWSDQVWFDKSSIHSWADLKFLSE